VFSEERWGAVRSARRARMNYRLAVASLEAPEEDCHNEQSLSPPWANGRPVDTSEETQFGNCKSWE